MTQAFTTQIENGIAEIVIDKAPVNAQIAVSGMPWQRSSIRLVKTLMRGY